MIEELSKIRALRSADFQRQDPLDSPKVTNPYVRLSKGPMREYEPESDRDALRQLNLMLQSGVAQPQERHKRQKYVCAQLRRKKTQLIDRWEEYEAVLERRTGQHFLDVQQDRSAKQI
jgi:hypothetical protein